MESREWAFWIEGEEEGSKGYISYVDGERLLQFLKDNDPIKCGADHLLLSTIEKLKALGEDEELPLEEIV
jgi:hypothetical protein